MKNKCFLILPLILLSLTGCDFNQSSSSSNISTSSTDTSTTSISNSDTEISSSLTSGSSISSSSSSSSELTGDKVSKLDLYYVNDFHGRISPQTSTTSNGSTIYEGGISRLSTYLNKQKSNNEDGTIFLNAGDLWQDTYDSGQNKGELLTKAFKEIGFDAIALGNHEFDWGTEIIKHNKSIAESGDEKFTFLGCNIYNYDNSLNKATTQASDIASPYKIITRGGTKIGLIGAIGRNQITSITSRNWENLTFLDPSSIVKELSDKLRIEEKCDVIIYMLHAALKDSNYEELSKKSPNSNRPYVDVGFLGHSHAFESETINNVPWVQSYHHGALTGHVTLTLKDGKYQATYSSSYNDRNNNGFGNGTNSIYACENDPKIDNIVNQYLTPDFLKEKNTVVGKFSNVTTSTFGDEAGEIQAYATSKYIDELRKNDPSIPEVDLVFNNGNRANIDINSDGSVTKEDIFNLIPFTNNTIIAEVSGSDIIYEMRYISYYLPKEQTLKIESNKKYIIAGIDYLVLHKNAEREYNYFKTYKGSIYEIEKYPFDIVSDYLLANKTFDVSIVNSTAFSGLTK